MNNPKNKIKMINNSSKILHLFAREPWKKLTFKEIKKLSKSKSESYVYNVIKAFVKEGVLKQENVGNVIQYSVSESQKAIFYLSTSLEQYAMKEDLPLESLQKIIPSKLYTLIVTGSYASKKQTPKSDLDVVLICDIDAKKVYSELRHFCEMSIPKIHLYVFSPGEFRSMLLDKNANYGKETAKNNLVVSGAEAYLRILLEAVKNGFAG